MQVATQILEQLGGNRFVAMTGAKNLVAFGDGLQFNIGRGAKNKANKVVIRLEGDLYRVTFYNVRGVDFKMCGEFGTVYADRLQAVFTEATGLDTHL